MALLCAKEERKQGFCEQLVVSATKTHVKSQLSHHPARQNLYLWSCADWEVVFSCAGIMNDLSTQLAFFSNQMVSSLRIAVIFTFLPVYSI